MSKNDSSKFLKLTSWISKRPKIIIAIVCPLSLLFIVLFLVINSLFSKGVYKIKIGKFTILAHDNARASESKDKIKKLENEIHTIKIQLENYRRINEISTNIYKTYEWQWAGENWYGRVTFAKRNNENIIEMAKIGLLNKLYNSDNNTYSYKIKDEVLYLLNQGTFEMINDKQIKIDLNVKKKTTTNENFVPHSIKGTLSKQLCFAGKIEYLNMDNGKKSTGDIILVDYLSVDENITNWFSEGQRLK